jgi:dipeptidyl aminopeptidase/acylaminoacyl peptidase
MQYISTLLTGRARFLFPPPTTYLPPPCTLNPMLYRLTIAILLSGALFAQKRPLTHRDYDAWRSIRGPQLSRDGKFLAYALFPQEGDGEFVVRNLTTGKEWRESAGQTPPPPRPDPAQIEEAPPQARSITIAFTHDSKYVVFSTFPPDAEVEKAKRARKKPDEMPKNGLATMDLATGAVKKVDRVKSFHVPEEGGDFVAWLHETAKGSEKTSPLVVRNLASGNDRKIDAVSEFTLSKDGKTLVFASDSVYAVDPASDAPPTSLFAAKGNYSKLTWDDKQNQLAFVSDAGRLYLWDRQSPSAAEVASPNTPGLGKGFVISDKGTVAFSKDGQRVLFGCAPPPTPPVKRDDTPDDEKVSVDLWHWKDDYIQPMQKVRAAVDRNRSYRGVYHIAEKKLLQLADVEMADLTPSEDGPWAIGGDDREYRPMQEYDERYRDSYLVNMLDGSRKLMAKKHAGNIGWSPDGKYALLFDGHDWNTISVPERRTVNLTSNLGVRFWNEDHDVPGRPAPYAPALWTKDGKWVLVSDHFDIWQIAPDGSIARNLTAGYGRKNRLMFRYVRLDESETPAIPGGRGGGGGGRERPVDPSKPLLLRAENYDTHDTGFFRTTIGAADPPHKLMYGAKNYGNPIKARDADVLVLTESTFEEFPDLQLTDMNFSELRKVSDANPQKPQFLWGTTELVHFKNVDGVPLSATLYKPENFDPRKKYPMIVYIYERLSQNVHTFVEPRPGHSINPTYYVSNGYLILEPDIVYTTGQPGQSALKCVLPAVQEMVDRGFVDESAIGIQGHSWGGYQIAYMVTQTTRFRAVAAGAPVANMTSAYDGIRWGPGIPRQFQYEKTQSRIGGSLWEYPMRYIENSPIFQADRVKTPVMMIHNDADDAVPWYQGIEYYLALRRLGKEAYLFTYNGEPHGLRRRPNQKDYTMRLQQYFDHFLKGAPKPDWMVHGIPYIESHPGAARGAAAETESQ